MHHAKHIIFFVILGWLFFLDLRHLSRLGVDFGWLVMLWVTFSGLAVGSNLIKLYRRIRYQGYVTEDGIKTRKTQIPFDKITKIGRQVTLPFAVVTKEKSDTVVLNNADIVKLSRYFKKWNIEGQLLSTTKGSDKLSIVFNCYGRYRGLIDYISWKWVLGGSLVGWLFRYCSVFLVFWFIFVTLLTYKFRIEISDEGLYFEDKQSKFFVLFSQIREIRIRQLKVVVALNDGRILNFPRTFLLGELLSECQVRKSNTNNKEGTV